MDWGSFGGVPRGFGIVGDSYVRLFVSDFGLCWSTGGDIGTHFKNIMRCHWDRYRGVWMFSLCGVVPGVSVEFPILVCDLAVGTDTIIGTDVLGSVLPHTLDITNGLLFTEGGGALRYRSDTLSGRVFTVGHCSVPPYSEAV